MRNGFRLKGNNMEQVLQENSIVTLEVLRIGEMGAFLDGGTVPVPSDSIAGPQRKK